MARRHAKKDEADINITPMLDIVFIMLIFFIVTTSFTKETGADITKPSAESTERKPRGNILVGIRSNGDIWMNGGEIELRQVRSFVERAVAENPEGEVVVIADQGTKTSDLVKVMDQIKAAGFEKLTISADEPSGV
jgi:biopolymer transport protein ExbD